MPVRPLTLAEREEIRVGIEQAMSDGEIAHCLGRCRTTINREINRNGGRDRYRAVRAQQRARRERGRPKTPILVDDPELAAEVTRRLEALDSPKRISIELAAEGHHISHETIYQAIRISGRGLRDGLHRCLQHPRRRRKHRGVKAPGSNSLGIYCRIHDRPAAATNRSEIGHLEGDLIVGAYNRSALITLFDRKSRHSWIEPVEAKTADAVYTSLSRLFTSRLPAALVRTLSWDQGAEIARHIDLALAFDIEIYIADPKSPWQRPTNEAGNALIRRYVGKGTNLKRFTTNQLRHIEHRINTIPRPSLDWATAHHVYHQAVATTT